MEKGLEINNYLCELVHSAYKPYPSSFALRAERGRGYCNVTVQVAFIHKKWLSNSINYLPNKNVRT